MSSLSGTERISRLRRLARLYSKSGSNLPLATYYFRIVAEDDAGGTTNGSLDAYCTITTANRNAHLDWAPVQGAKNYRVYIGIALGAQDKYLTSPTTSFDYPSVSPSEIPGNVPPVTTAFVNKLSAAGSSWILGGNVGIGTSNPQATLDVAGTIKSPMWNVTQVMNMRLGGYPTMVSDPFDTGGGTLLIFASGSGYQSTGLNPPNPIGMTIKLDVVNLLVGSAKSYSNERDSHKSFTANALVVNGIPAGTYHIHLDPTTGTLWNSDDFFSVTVLELPF